MTNNELHITKIISPIAIILFAVVLRLLPHPANVAPITALALFGGAYLDKRFAIIIPLTAMVISDLFLGFHESMVMVYGSFLLITGIGMWLRSHRTVHTIIGASLVSSTLFFLLTNFNYWYGGSLYPKTISGLFESYVMALPFFRNTILGDLFYTGLFFGSYELLVNRIMHQELRIKENKNHTS